MKGERAKTQTRQLWEFERGLAEQAERVLTKSAQMPDEKITVR